MVQPQRIAVALLAVITIGCNVAKAIQVWVREDGLNGSVNRYDTSANFLGSFLPDPTPGYSSGSLTVVGDEVWLSFERGSIDVGGVNRLAIDGSFLGTFNEPKIGDITVVGDEVWLRQNGLDGLIKRYDISANFLGSFSPDPVPGYSTGSLSVVGNEVWVSFERGSIDVGGINRLSLDGVFLGTFSEPKIGDITVVGDEVWLRQNGLNGQILRYNLSGTFLSSFTPEPVPGYSTGSLSVVGNEVWVGLERDHTGEINRLSLDGTFLSKFFDDHVGDITVISGPAAVAVPEPLTGALGVTGFFVLGIAVLRRLA